MVGPNPLNTARLIAVGCVVGAIVLGTVAGIGFASEVGDKTGKVRGSMRIGTTGLTVELPIGPDAPRLGLSERDSVARGTDGMYFGAFGMVGFGMEGMRFCLDFIWIADGRVVGVTEDACPTSEGSAPTFYPPESITAAIETPAGWVASHGIATGDPVSGVTISPRTISGMVEKAARNDRFVTGEIAMVSDALAFVGVDAAPIAARMDAADNDGTISKREIRRIRVSVRSVVSVGRQGSRSLSARTGQGDLAR